MKEAIQKAIEGGWFPKELTNKKERYKFSKGMYEDGLWFFDTYDFFGRISEFEAEENVYIYLSDPLFWQCLGKSLGWESKDGIHGICSITRKKCELNPVFLADCLCHRQSTVNWKSEWHRFIDHLAEGKSADEFFNNLLK